MQQDSPRELDALAVRRYGTERAGEMAGALRRLAGALATVEGFELPAGVEPLPVVPPELGAQR